MLWDSVKGVEGIADVDWIGGSWRVDVGEGYEVRHG